jgi:hypothetical protein
MVVEMGGVVLGAVFLIMVGIMGGVTLQTLAKSTDSVARSRQRLLALFLPASAALLTIGEALTPQGLDTPITTTAIALQMLPIAAQYPNQLYLSNLLVILGLVAMAVSFVALTTLVKGRGATLATIAALIGGFGSLAGALVNILVGFNLAAVTQAHLSLIDAARFLVTTFNSEVGNVLTGVYIFGTFGGTILIAIALWRARNTPRWLPVLFVIGQVVGIMAPAGIVSIPLSLPFAIAMFLLAFRIWRSATPPHGANL